MLILGDIVERNDLDSYNFMILLARLPPYAHPIQWVLIDRAAISAVLYTAIRLDKHEGIRFEIFLSASTTAGI
jgi:hypothetical protein